MKSCSVHIHGLEFHKMAEHNLKLVPPTPFSFLSFSFLSFFFYLVLLIILCS